MFRKIEQNQDGNGKLSNGSLISMMRDLGKTVEFDATKKVEQKAHLMKMISSRQELLSQNDENLVFSLRNWSSLVQMNDGLKKKIRFNLMEKVSTAGWNWVSAWKVMKQGVAGFLLFMFVVGGAVVLPFEHRVTKAYKWTYLEQVNGEVYVNRDGRIFAANSSFGLIENDIIITRTQSSAIIRFMDDSLVRLSENTSLQLEKAIVNSGYNGVETEINLLLAGGKVWARVVNMIGTRSIFSIETDNAKTTANVSSAFEVIAEPSKTKVAVYENVVDLTSKLDQISAPQTVLTGYHAEVDSLSIDLRNGVDSKVVLAKNDEQNSEWVQQNIQMDIAHQKKLMEENREFIVMALDKENSVSGVLAQIKDITLPEFKTPEIEELRKRFLAVHMDFLMAEKLLVESSDNNKNRTESLKYFYNYRNYIRELREKRNELLVLNQSEANALFAFINSHIDSQLKMLAPVLPNENLYLAKKDLEEIAVLLAFDGSDLLEHEMSFLRQQLVDINGLISLRNFKSAKSIFDDYLTRLAEVSEMVNESEETDLHQKFFALLDQQVIQLKLLNSIKIQLLEKQEEYFAGIVAQVQFDSADKLINIIASNKSEIPYNLVLDLRSLITSYEENSQDKIGLIARIETVLKGYADFQKVLAEEALQKQKQEELNLLINTKEEELVLDFDATTEVVSEVENCLENCENEAENG